VAHAHIHRLVRILAGGQHGDPRLLLDDEFDGLWPGRSVSRVFMVPPGAVRASCCCTAAGMPGGRCRFNYSQTTRVLLPSFAARMAP
jgi:hypothetical protein